jgi:hypothetical protein
MEREQAQPSTAGPDSWARIAGELSVLVPEGWLRNESVTLLHPERVANVIASTEPLIENLDAKRYSDIQGELLSEFPAYREIRSEEMRAFGGLEGFMRLFEWTPQDGAPVTQIQVYAVADGRGLTATATCPTTEFSSVELLLVGVLEGLIFHKEAHEPMREPRE